VRLASVGPSTVCAGSVPSAAACSPPGPGWRESVADTLLVRDERREPADHSSVSHCPVLRRGRACVMRWRCGRGPGRRRWCRCICPGWCGRWRARPCRTRRWRQAASLAAGASTVPTRAPRDAAAAARPWHGAPYRQLPSPFPHVTLPGCAAGWHCRLPWPAKSLPGRASVVLACNGDGSPFR